MKYIRHYIYMGAIMCTLSFVGTMAKDEMTTFQKDIATSFMTAGGLVIGSGAVGSMMLYFGEYL